MTKNKKLSQKEKPPFLYHGSPRGEIEEFEPSVSGGSGEKYGALVCAAPDLATAIIFMVRVKGGWSAGRFFDVPYVLLPVSRDEFIEDDAGGYIYILPSDTFNSERDQYCYHQSNNTAEVQFRRIFEGVGGRKILVDFDARTGHNHGTKFRMRQDALPMLYEKTTIII
jgi:hypothetical protein